MSVTVDHRPPLGSLAGSIFIVVVMAVVLALSQIAAALVALLAIPVFVVAGSRGNRRALVLGVIAMLFALLMAGLNGGSPVTILTAGVLAVTAWDLLDQGFSLGDHVGRSSVALRNKVVHGGATVFAGAIIALVISVGLSEIPSGWPVTAIVFALLAGMFALLALEFKE